MSSVFLHVGQAGCQLAQALWPALASERPASPDFFYQRQRVKSEVACPRAVLIDSEPKVVRSTLALSSENFAFDSECTAVSNTGRGGNFALGFSGGYTGGPLPAPVYDERPDLVEAGLECVRKQVDRCRGAHLGTIAMYSLGGGTGSGLCSRLLEEVRDTFPKGHLLALSILPLAMGENPMQSFNTTLALALAQELTDGVYLYENDHLLAACSERPQDTDNAEQRHTGSSLASMNAVVVQDMLPFLCPSQRKVFDICESLGSVCALPTHRFAQAFSAKLSIPQGPIDDMRPLLDRLSRRVPRVWRHGREGSVLALHAAVRGAHLSDVKGFSEEVLNRFGGAVPWQPFSMEVKSSPAVMKTWPGMARLSVLTNNKRSGLLIKSALDAAKAKFASRAFLHWYERYGFGADSFAHAFETLEGVVANYEAA